MSAAARLSLRQARRAATAVVIVSVAAGVSVVTWVTFAPPPPVADSPLPVSNTNAETPAAEVDLSKLRPLWQLPLRRPLGEASRVTSAADPASPVVAPPAVEVVGLVGEVALVRQAGQIFSLRVGETRDGVGTLEAVERGRIVLSYRGNRVTLDLPYDAAPDRLISQP